VPWIISTRGRGPLGTPTNSPVIDSGTSARVRNTPSVPLGAVIADDALRGRPSRGIGGNPAPVAQLPELQLKSRGDDVERLQRLLNSRLYGRNSLKVDGQFGPRTRAAVVEFQKKSKLTADGIAGRRTWFVLLSAAPAKQASAGKSFLPSRPASASAVASSTTTTTATSADSSSISPAAIDKSVDQWSMEDRFGYVLQHTGRYLGPDMRAQFAALITGPNLAIMIGCLVVWAAGHFCGVSEFTDAFLLGFGLVYMGRAVFDAARYLKNFLELTCTASTESELDDAASNLAQALAIIGIVAFFSLLAKVGRAVGKATKGADEAEMGGAAPKDEASVASKPEPEARAPKQAAEQTKVSEVVQSGEKTTLAKNVEAGRAFEQRGLDHLETVQSNVEDQVSIRPHTETGELADYRVRLDAVGTDEAGTIRLTDFKSSDSAGFTPNQKAGYALLKEYGGQVVGNNGGAAYPAGTQIPPTEVDILRPGDF
jgi:hypothetical protein